MGGPLDRARVEHREASWGRRRPVATASGQGCCLRCQRQPHCGYVREGYSEQRADQVRDRGRDERPRQPRSQLSAAMERRAQPGAARNPAESSRPALFRSTPYAGASFLTGVRTPRMAGNRSTRNARPSGPYLRSGRLIASGGASCLSMASSNGRRSRDRRPNSPMPSP